MSEKVANNISIYNQESNYTSYYRLFFSKAFDHQMLGIPELPRNLPVSALDRRWVIERKYHYRIDLISHKWYGREYLDFIWILMLYNQPIENTARSTTNTVGIRSKRMAVIATNIIGIRVVRSRSLASPKADMIMTFPVMKVRRSGDSAVT